MFPGGSLTHTYKGKRVAKLLSAACGLSPIDSNARWRPFRIAANVPKLKSELRKSVDSFHVHICNNACRVRKRERMHDTIV